MLFRSRELRMIRELEETKDAIRFDDVFPDIREVVVYGLNELAYYFVKYLEHMNIPVMVSGRHWKHLHYQDVGDIEDDDGRMIVFAEPVMGYGTDLFQRVVRSSSPEFECIDQIYEQNVLAGKIKNVRGGADWFFETLKGKKCSILGVDVRAQDAYDLLYQHGVDIENFLVKNTENDIPMTLLGKNVSTVENTVCYEKDAVFISVSGRNSALGTADVDFFDYYGYRRNEQFFLINDYTSIPYSNLVHILGGKKLSLVGDEILCRILVEYLEKVENGNISVRYIELSQWDPTDKQERMLFIVHPVYGWHGDVDPVNNPELWEFKEQLKKIRGAFYLEYFSRAGVFVLIDEYMNQNREKYLHKQMIPKGILLGAMPSMSGNFLIRGLLDGHPDILKVSWSELNHNLFWYCIRLAWEQSGRITYAREDNFFFPDWKFFKESVARVHIEGRMTSQEIFLAFHRIYMESIRKEPLEDLSQMVVYWEPHISREDHLFWAKWLESEKIDGHTLITCRNHVVWYGSNYKWYSGGGSIKGFLGHISAMTCEDYSYQIPLRHWKAFTLRFEDIKLHPKEELLKLCSIIGIPWSDSMLHTTIDDREYVYNGVVDFDMKPVFNPYEEFMSAFDRFRVCLISSAYQKKYGYMYENCLRFSRRELQEMFLKKFRFQDLMNLNVEDETTYYLCAYASLKQQLWEARKHAVLNDIIPEFKPVEIGTECTQYSKRQEELDRLAEFVKKQEKLILYGTGQDCKVLWEYLDEADKEKILFCDRKAIQDRYIYQGKSVLTPMELRSTYRDYMILITSSWYGLRIQMELENMGICQNRIERNTVPLGKA